MSREPQTESLLHSAGVIAPGRRPRAFVRVATAGAAAVALAVVLAGCSSNSSSSASSTSSSSSAASSSSDASSAGASTGYPAGKEQVCQARDQLKTSITALTNPTLLVGGADAIKAAVGQVQTDLGAVVTAGKQDYEPQVTAVQSSLDKLQTAVGNLGNGNVTQNLQAVGTAIAGTGTAAAALFTQLQTACGS